MDKPILSRLALWMPKGSIRALIALVAIIVTGVLLLMGKDIPNEWWMAFSAIITFYFGAGAVTDTSDAINGGKK